MPAIKCHARVLRTIHVGGPTIKLWAQARGFILVLTHEGFIPLGAAIHVDGNAYRVEQHGGSRVVFFDRASVTIQDEPYPVRIVPQEWRRLVVKEMVRELYRYQIDGAAWVAQRLARGKGSFIADEQGLGKTTQAIAAICVVGAFPCLIVCPGSLKDQWARELHWAKRAPSSFILEGWMGSIPPSMCHIVNYDLLRTRERQLKTIPYKCIVFDESQAVKAPIAFATHRASVATRIAKGVPSILISGTPIMNRVEEMWRQLHILDPKEWPDFRSFRERYCSVTKKEQEQAPVADPAIKTRAGSFGNTVEFRTRMDPYVMRRLKRQVLADLPPKSRHSLPVTLGPAEMLHYKAAEADVVSWLHSLGETARANRAVRSKIMVKLTMLRRISAIAKLRVAVPSYLRAWFGGEGRAPLVVFGYHRDVVRGVYRICERLKLKIAGIGGAESSRVRDEQVRAFSSGWADVFVASIQCAAFGLNLQRAQDMLIIERVYSPMVLLQAEDRIHRLGQKAPVTINYLDAVGTIDEMMLDVLTAKKALVQAAIDAIPGTAIEEDVIDRFWRSHSED